MFLYYFGSPGVVDTPRACRARACGLVPQSGIHVSKMFRHHRLLKIPYRREPL